MYLLSDSQAKNTIKLEKIDKTRNEDERMLNVLSFMFWAKFNNIQSVTKDPDKHSVKNIELIMDDIAQYF
jgi:hypothetical protein